LEADGSVAFSITDTGIGIAPADIPKVMESFGQVVALPQHSHEGVGLGLPISRALVELHSGRFELTSEPGIGTTVTVYLPHDRIVGRSAHF
jgi:signal transduction histidine kinase